MTDFQRDMEVMINEEIFNAKNGKVRFMYRFPERMYGTLDLLELSERAYNCCCRSHISTIEEVGRRWNELGKMRGSGVKTVKEIKNSYINYYYSQLDDEERKDFWRDAVEATANM